MALGIQDNLIKADRTTGVVAAARNVQNGGGVVGGTDVEGKSGGWRSRVGETFAQALNRSLVKSGTAGETAATGGDSFGAILNKQQMVKTDAAEQAGPAEGESLVGYLNRKKSAAGVNGKQVSGQAGGATSGGPGAATAAKKVWHRTGETAAEKLNNQQDVDAAAAAHAKAEKAASGLVSNALILPILKQVRRSSLGENSVYSGGNGEKAFGPEFDMQLADRIAQSPRLGVREALVQRLEKRSPVSQLQPARKSAKVASRAPSRIDVNG